LPPGQRVWDTKLAFASGNNSGSELLRFLVTALFPFGLIQESAAGLTDVNVYEHHHFAQIPTDDD
jgi:hypothetical protein